MASPFLVSEYGNQILECYCLAEELETYEQKNELQEIIGLCNSDSELV